MNAFDLHRHRLRRGTVVLQASAGTGKTFALTALAIRLLLEGIEDGPVPTLDRILLVTFTNKATDELRRRLRRRLDLARRLWQGEADERTRDEAEQDGFLAAYLGRREAQREADLQRLRAAEAVVDQAPISTIHGFCLRVLTLCAARIGLPPDVAIAEDEAARRTNACREAWRSVISREADATVVEEVLGGGLQGDGNDDEAEDTGRGLSFADLAREHAAWVVADRPFLPVEEDPAGLRQEWDGLDAAARLAAAEAAWREACVRGGAERRRNAARRLLLLRADHRLDLGCRRDGVLTLGMLQQRLRDALRDPQHGAALARELQERHPAALVDEFQDTDPVQMAIFTAAFAGGLLRCVGDPKQSIYRFRGADLHAYAAFAGRLPEADREEMALNWRSAPDCVAAVNHLFREERRPFVHPGIAFAPAQAQRPAALLHEGEGAALVWWWCDIASKGEAVTALAEAVAAEAQRLLDQARYGERGLRAKDIAVLTASNRQAALVAQALRNVGVPAVDRSQVSVLASEAADELAAILAALADPVDGGLARTALCTRLWGGTASLLQDAARLGGELAELRRLARGWRQLGVLGIAAALLDRATGGTTGRERLLAAAGGERYLTDLLHAAELAHGAGERPAAILAWLRGEREAGALGEAARLRLEDDGDAVAVLTVHAAKGLEWPVVFAPFLWCAPSWRKLLCNAAAIGTQRPAKHRDAHGWVWDWRSVISEEAAEAHDADERAEGVRQAYVALTRARERTYVAWGPMGKAKRDAARSGLSLIAGPALAEAGPPTARGQAEAAIAQLWPDQPSAETIKAAGLLQQFPRGARKADLLRAGVAETSWDKVRKELEHFGWATRQANTLFPTGKSLSDVPRPPDAASFRAAIAVGRVEPPPAPALRRPRAEAGADWAAARPGGRLRRPWTITSFSGLTRGADEQHLAGALGDERPATARGPALGIHAFPAGPGPGDRLHRIIERADLAHPRSAANRELVRELLAGERDAEGRHDDVLALLADLGASTIPGTTTALAEIPAGSLRHEWPFDLAVMAGSGSAGLAEACRRHADAVLDATWAERLARLAPHDLHGFLTGRADLVACIDGRWWVLDWKSNRLGSDAEAYASEALREDAYRHHYPLQWLIYLVALHRHLAARLADYRPERDLGGAAYCWLRGLRRDDRGAGWLVHRPSAALLAACDAALGRHPPEPA